MRRGTLACAWTLVACATPVEPTGTASQALGYQDADFIAAASVNFQQASRGVGDIDHVVIHTMEGTFDGTIGWFRNPMAKVSAHYLVRSSDGHVTQMVEEEDIAYHDKCFNTHTVGIEHEGKVAEPERWYTEDMYVASAKLTAYLCDKYGIPKEYGSIIGHDAAPDCSDHDDPGPGWDWPHYIDLVRSGGNRDYLAGDVTVDAPAELASGARARVTVAFVNRGAATWDDTVTRLGTTGPRDRASAFYVEGDWLGPDRATAADGPVEPGATGTFTFDIVAPPVDTATDFDEAFQLVQDDVAWFGPEAHVSLRVVPADPDDGEHGGCSASAGAGWAVALGALALRRRRR